MYTYKYTCSGDDGGYSRGGDHIFIYIYIYYIEREREGGKTKKHSNLNSSGVASVVFRVVTCHVGGVERKMEVPCHVVRHVGAMEDVIFSHVS